MKKSTQGRSFSQLLMANVGYIVVFSPRSLDGERQLLNMNGTSAGFYIVYKEKPWNV